MFYCKTIYMCTSWASWLFTELFHTRFLPVRTHDLFCKLPELERRWENYPLFAIAYVMGDVHAWHLSR